MRILNRPSPAAFTESVRYAEQNLYDQPEQLVGQDWEPRAHSFSVQLRTFYAAKSGAGTGMAVLFALCSSLLEQSPKGGLAIMGALNLGGSVNPVELAAGKGASHTLMPVSARKQLVHLLDVIATDVTLLYYADASDALVKALDGWRYYATGVPVGVANRGLPYRSGYQLAGGDFYSCGDQGSASSFCGVAI